MRMQKRVVDPQRKYIIQRYSQNMRRSYSDYFLLRGESCVDRTYGPAPLWVITFMQSPAIWRGREMQHEA